MKTCTKCGHTKDESEFYKDGHVKSGLSAACKACVKLLSRLRREDPLEKTKIGIRRSRWKEAHPEKHAEAKRKHVQKAYLNPKTKRWWPD